ncbi:hypothetical protein QE152_g13111 [Popillia japonica]|uniref:Protein TIC 214 n=1 Tax=Popillia japonica TaxID=7064 RepID=A0AAW1LFG2_POPJA
MDNCRNRQLSLKELDNAEKRIIWLTQRELFKEEQKELRSGTVNKRSKIRNLNPYLDKEGLIISTLRNRQLSLKELDNAEKRIIWLTQRESFKEEQKELRSGTVNKRSKIRNLNPYLDKEGLIRVGQKELRSGTVNKRSKIRNLNPYLDKEGLIRVG